MPLESGKSKEAFKHNVEAEVAAGKPQKQAVAIAYSKASDSAIKAAGILFMADDCVLMLKRAALGDRVGMWAFPGGKIEGDEIPEETARRECAEEVGYVPQETLQQIDFTDNGEVAFTTFFCVTTRFVPQLNEEHDGYVWAKLNDLPSPLHPGCATLLSNFNPAVFTMDSAQKTDINDYITIENNPISRSGIFPYLGKSIPGAEDPNKVYNVYRPAEEIADQDAIDSFKLIPLIDDHAMLGPSDKKLLPAEMKGIHGTTGESVFFRDGVLYATLKIYSQTLSEMVQQGKRDLSLGYRCIYEKVSGVFEKKPYDYIQRNLRGNHLALVNEARCDVSVLDNLAFDHFDLALDKGEFTTMAKEDAKEDDKKVEDKAKDSTEEGGSSAEGEQKEEGSMKELHATLKALLPMHKKIAQLLKESGMDDEEEESTATADGATVKPSVTPGGGGSMASDEDKEKEGKGMDSAIKSLTAQVAELKKGGFKAIMHEAKERDGLASRLSQHVGTFDHSEMTKDEVAAYGVEKLGLKAPKGQEAAALEGFLHNRQASSAGYGLDNSAQSTQTSGKFSEFKTNTGNQ